jgi:tRNA (guanine37-N1)-methyltransferase
MRIDVLTLFPGLIDNFADESLLGKAQERNLLDVRAHNIRDHTDDNHHTVDDAPFGGGAGMVMLPDPIFRCVEVVQPPRPLFLMGPGGRVFDQQMAQELSEGEGFSLLCGRYEGIDQRVHDELIDDEVSIGDYVLGGGEVAALVIIEAVGRLVPGVMGNDASGLDESFSDGLLEYPQYTRPKEYRGMGVPDVLRSGDHGKVDRWRKAMALRKTLDRRPDLIEARGGLSPADQKLLTEFMLPGREIV